MTATNGQALLEAAAIDAGSERIRQHHARELHAHAIVRTPDQRDRVADTLRLAAFLWITPFCAARMIVGSASLSAATALARSPDAIASSIFTTAVRRCERRDLLTAVRRAIWRVAFWADDVLAMQCLGTVSRSNG